MPTTKEKNPLQRASGSQPYGAGGERSGEPPAPPPGTRAARELSQAIVDDAADRARLRSMLERPDGDRIPDEVIDQLLASQSSVAPHLRPPMGTLTDTSPSP